MFATPHRPRRLPRLRTRAGRGALVTAAAAVSFALVPLTAQAGPSDVELKSVYAMPVNASPTAVTPARSTADNEKVLCTPEGPGRRIYGTENPFDTSQNSSSPTGIGTGWPASVSQGYPQSTSPDPAYTAPNMPSTASLTPALQAGASNDLCFGFTLTPNVQAPADANDDTNPNFILAPASKGGNPDPTLASRLQDDPPVPDVAATHVALSADGKTPINNDDLKTAKIELPAGFLGDPDSIATCSNADFRPTNYGPVNCQAGPTAEKPNGNTQVGTAFVRISTVLNIGAQELALGGAPNASGGFDGGQVFNLEHSANELARLGVTVTPAAGLAPAKFVVRLLLDPDGSGRVQSTVESAPRNVFLNSAIDKTVPAPGVEPTYQPKSTAIAYPLYVESVGIRAWGKVADHPFLTKDFAQWGTDCTSDLSAHAAVETYLGVKSEMSSVPFRLTGCDKLAPFQPSVTVKTAETSPAVPTATEVTLDLPQGTNAAGLPTPLLKNASVTLPAGLEIGAQVAARDGGLKLCSKTQFALDSSAPNACPAGSSVGDLSIISPLQSRPFVGRVYLGEQSAVGELPALYLEAAPDGATAADAPRIKLVGAVKSDENGQITTTFTDTPQLRFSQLKLSFSGGPNALFSTPRTCGDSTGTSSFLASNGFSATATSTLSITTDCATPGFSPSFSMTPSNAAAGAKAPTTITMARDDRTPWLTGIKVSLPAGFLADLTQASECPSAQAATGDCSDDSRIATVTTVAGVGPNPYTLTGKMYLSERPSGAVAGGTIVVRAQLGDLDLGNVVVPAQIDLRPTDAGLVIATTAPTRFRGLALNLRSISVNLDRPNFALNPSACGPLQASGDFTGDGGQTARATTSVGYTGCASRPFQPALTASLSGEVKPLGHPQVNVSIKTRPGDSNLKSTTLMLPAGVSSDLKNVQVTCARALFDAGNCPSGTKVGTATARVAITNDVLTGDVFIVHVDGQVLPGLGLSFGGRYTQRITSLIKTDQKTSRLVSVFDAIPDLPLTSLDLTVTGGAKSPIQLSSAACTADSAWDATFGGQGGQTSKSAVPYPCATIPVPKPTVKWSKKSGIKLTITPPTGKTIKSAKITLPSGFTIKSAKSKAAKKTQAKNLKFTVSGGKAKTKISSKSVSITASGTGPTKATVTVKPKAYTLSKKVAKSFKKGKKVKLKIRVVGSNGQVLSSTVSVKISG